MSVRDYYYQHFDELDSYDQFHFASRIKNYFKTHDFDDYFKQNVLDQDLAPIFANNDYSKVNNAAERKPYFDKYPNLYAIEAALFRVNHLLNEWGIDIRDQFLQYEPKASLYALCDALLADDGAIATLSTWAVNVICLTEYLFPRGKNVVKQLSEKALQLNFPNPLLAIYLYTHIIICDTIFYTRPVNPDNKELFVALLDRCAEIITQNFDDLILDVRIEFLVCANLVGKDYPELRQKIQAECAQILSSQPFITDPRRPKSRHTLSRAEHTNVLYIMSGLDT